MDLFGKDWRCDLLEGGVSLGVGFVVLEPHTSPSPTLSGCKLKISCELSAAASVAMAACCHTLHHDYHGLIL